MPNVEKGLTLPQLQDFIKRLCIEKGWNSNNVFEIFLLFTEEVGELAKAIRYSNELHVEEHKKKNIDLEGEFADVFGYLLDLANGMGVDLESAFIKKMKQIDERNWS